MFDLEHLILFGLPENKLEWFDGRASCRLPFASRAQAEAAFVRCTETLARWQDIDDSPSIARRGDQWRAAAGGITLELIARVLGASIPIYPDAIHEFQERFWQTSLWPREESISAGEGSGFWQWSEARTNIPIYLMGLAGRGRRGWSCGRVDVVLPGLAIVQPDAFFYGPERQGCLIDQAYFVGPPDLIVEVVAPSTAAWTRGCRADLYCRAGVPHFWVADPRNQTLETWTVQGGCYRPGETYAAGQRFRHPLFPDIEVDVKEMLQSRGELQPTFTGSRGERPGFEADLSKPIPLQNLLLAGHPDRRYEVMDGRTPCVVAFGSEMVAEQRFREWAAEIARWENATITDDEGAGRFDLRRDGTIVALDVRMEFAACDEILRAYHSQGVWEEYNHAVDGLPA